MRCAKIMAARMMAVVVVLAVALMALGWPTRTAVAMDAETFAELKKQVEDASFSSDRLNVIRAAVSSGHTFSCAQVRALLDAMSFSSDKHAALKLLKDRIEDPANVEQIIDGFSFESDKRTARQELAGIRAAVPTPAPSGHLPPLVLPHAGAWPAEDFSALIAALDAASFSRERRQILRERTRRPEGFTSAQVLALLERFSHSTDMVGAIRDIDSRILGLTSAEVVTLLGRFSFSTDKLNVLEVVVECITDAERKFTILDAFTFSADKTKAQVILDRLKPRSHLYGTVRAEAVVFVVDASRSMAAQFGTNRHERLSRLDLARNELKLVLAHQLRPTTRFNIIAFNDEVRLWKDQSVPATPENVAEAVRFLDALQPRGRANIFGALEKAFADPAAQAIYFLTAGKPTHGATTDADIIVSTVREWNAQRPRLLHTIAMLMGEARDDDKPQAARLMFRLATETNGTFVRLDASNAR